MTFDSHAHAFLESLAETLEEQLPDDDIDFASDILTIIRADGRQYVINKHAPTQQIWLSSPNSGAWHFVWEQGQWRDTRQQQALTTLLMQELGVNI